MAGSPKRKVAPQRAPASKAVLKEFLSGLLRLAGPVADGMGLEIVQVQCPVEGGQPVVRLFIDKTGAGADDMISLDDCAEFSRALDAAVEEAGYDHPEIEEYLMEVSSPGLDRPLVRARDYERFQGSLVKMKLKRDGRNVTLNGRLGHDASGLAIQTADGPIAFVFADVVSCRLSLDEIFLKSEDAEGIDYE